MKDREFWLTVRRALIMFVRAIEKRYDLKTQPFCEVAEQNQTGV